MSDKRKLVNEKYRRAAYHAIELWLLERIVKARTFARMEAFSEAGLAAITAKEAIPEPAGILIEADVRYQRQPGHVEIWMSGTMAFDDSVEKVEAAVRDTHRVTLNIINGLGGSSRLADQLYDLLSVRDTTCHIVGKCSSASTIVACAAKRILMTANSQMMVHVCRHECIIATAKALRELADSCDESDRRSMEVYLKRTKQPREVIAGWLDGEDHYFTAEECVKLGLADEIVEDPLGERILGAGKSE